MRGTDVADSINTSPPLDRPCPRDRGDELKHGVARVLPPTLILRAISRPNQAFHLARFTAWFRASSSCLTLDRNDRAEVIAAAHYSAGRHREAVRSTKPSACAPTLKGGTG